MSAPFASPQWAESVRASLDASADVRTQSMSWVYGPLVLVADPSDDPAFSGSAVRIALHEGTVEGVDVVDPADAARMPFVLGGSLDRWKAVFGGELSIVDGVLDSRLRVRGDLPALARHRALLDAVGAACGAVETTWPEPAPANA